MGKTTSTTPKTKKAPAKAAKKDSPKTVIAEPTPAAPPPPTPEATAAPAKPKRTTKPKAAAPVEPPTPTPVAAPTAKAAKPAAKRSTAMKPTAPKAKAKTAKNGTVAPVITNEDIALRAYFIAQHRQAHGHPGTPDGDWLEAERQLRLESVA